MKVWDSATRLYHWSQALLFIGLCISGFWEIGPHQTIGLCLATLVLWRLGWGIWGSETNQFRQFVKSPIAAINYLLGRAPQQQAGHNPAGGLMILLMLLALTAQCFIGMTQAGLFDAYLADDSILLDVEFVSTAHLYLAYLLISLVGIHISAVIIYSLKGEDILPAMISGEQQKTLPPVYFRPAWLAGVSFVLIATVMGYFFWQ